MKRQVIATLLVCALAGVAGAASFDDYADGNWDAWQTWAAADTGFPGAGDTATIDDKTVTANIAIDPGITLVDIQAGGTLYFANNQTAELQLDGGILRVGGNALTTSPVLSVKSASAIERPDVWSYNGATLTGEIKDSGTGITGRLTATIGTSDRLRINHDNRNFSGGWLVQEGRLDALCDYALGTGTITVGDGGYVSVSNTTQSATQNVDVNDGTLHLYAADAPN